VIVDIAQQTTKSVASLLREFAGFNKLESILLFKALSLPTLDAIVLTDFNNETFEVLRDRYPNKSFIIRTDKREEAKDLPRGGYKSSTENLDLYLPKLIEDGRIIILLAMPLSRYDHIYSMNLLFDYSKIKIEIVGKGFDMSDLNRGDVSPHEILEIPLNYNYKHDLWDIYDFMPLNIISFRRFLISQEDYRKSVKRRLCKIGKGLTKGEKNDKLPIEEAIISARSYLEAQGKTIILEDNEDYKPIPFALLHDIVKLVYYLPLEILSFNKPLEEFCLSCGVYFTGQIVFWDIVWPSIKFKLT